MTTFWFLAALVGLALPTIYAETLQNTKEIDYNCASTCSNSSDANNGLVININADIVVTFNKDEKIIAFATVEFVYFVGIEFKVSIITDRKGNLIAANGTNHFKAVHLTPDQPINSFLEADVILRAKTIINELDNHPAAVPFDDLYFQVRDQYQKTGKVDWTTVAIVKDLKGWVDTLSNFTVLFDRDNLSQYLASSTQERFRACMFGFFLNTLNVNLMENEVIKPLIWFINVNLYVPPLAVSIDIFYPDFLRALTNTEENGVKYSTSFLIAIIIAINNGGTYESNRQLVIDGKITAVSNPVIIGGIYHSFEFYRNVNGVFTTTISYYAQRRVQLFYYFNRSLKSFAFVNISLGYGFVFLHGGSVMFFNVKTKSAYLINLAKSTAMYISNLNLTSQLGADITYLISLKDDKGDFNIDFKEEIKKAVAGQLEAGRVLFWANIVVALRASGQLTVGGLATVVFSGSVVVKGIATLVRISIKSLKIKLIPIVALGNILVRIVEGLSLGVADALAKIDVKTITIGSLTGLVISRRVSFPVFKAGVSFGGGVAVQNN